MNSSSDTPAPPGDSGMIVMTMTSPACPLGDYLKDLVESMVKWRIPEVQEVEIDLVWEPRWNADMMSADAKQQLDGGTP